MPQIRVPRLYLNRCGVYCFRLKTAAIDKRFSLGTKCPRTAIMLALRLNTQIEQGRTMAIDPRNPKLRDILPHLTPEELSRYELDMERGIMRADGPDDHARMMEALDKFAVVRSRTIPPVSASFPPSSAPPAVLKSRLLSAVAKDWIEERKSKNGARTVYMKASHFKDFSKRIAENIEINSINKAVIVGYKSALLTAGQKSKTIDNKLLSLNDLFAYAMAHGEYTVSNESPVSGLFILSKQERIDKNEPYEQFSRAELAKIFEPTKFIAEMNEPDLFWAPLIALYTGMRISEVAQLRCHDFGEADGLPYLYVYRSKTKAGKRNLPIANDLVKLGLLDYLAEVRAAGAGRLFPNRPFVNGTYGKRLGERFGDYLKGIGIKRPHLSFHSFRANVITAMANANIHLMKSMKIAGHQHTEGVNDASIRVHFGYVRDIPDLKPVMDSFSWGLNLVGLKYDGRFKDFVANKKNWKPGEKGTLGGT